MTKGKLFTLSGPSGVGKGTIVEQLRKLRPDLGVSISCTTRTKRCGEVEGREYYFVSDDRFDEMIANNELLEYASVHGGRYGTPRKAVEEMLAQGKDILLEIDIQGSLKVLANAPDTIGIFILPPSLEILSERLRGRGTETVEQVETRLRNARHEIMEAEKFPYCIVNDQLDQAVEDVLSVMRAERIRSGSEVLDKLLDEIKEEEKL